MTTFLGRHTVVEVRRNLARLLDGEPLADARTSFDRDLASFAIVELDEATCELAATVAEQTGARTLDSLHLGAVQRVGGQGVSVLTFDPRQASRPVARLPGCRSVGRRRPR